MSDINYMPNFKFTDLVNSLEFTRKFKESGRMAIYFGTHDYEYNGRFHKAAPLHLNAYIHSMFSFISRAFPSFLLNSCLVNYYPNLNSAIPFHADNEKCIDKESHIVTLSLGETRTMIFRPIDPNLRDNHVSVALKNGDILIFSRTSQDFFFHGIPPSRLDPTNSPRPRVSLTFRKTV